MSTPMPDFVDRQAWCAWFDQLTTEEKNVVEDIVWQAVVEAGKADEVRAKLEGTP